MAWKAISEMQDASLIVAKTIEETDPFSRKVIEKVVSHAVIRPLTFG